MFNRPPGLPIWPADLSHVVPVPQQPQLHNGHPALQPGGLWSRHLPQWLPGKAWVLFLVVYFVNIGLIYWKITSIGVLIKRAWSFHLMYWLWHCTTDTIQILQNFNTLSHGFIFGDILQHHILSADELITWKIVVRCPAIFFVSDKQCAQKGWFIWAPPMLKLPWGRWTWNIWRCLCHVFSLNCEIYMERISSSE